MANGGHRNAKSGWARAMIDDVFLFFLFPYNLYL